MITHRCRGCGVQLMLEDRWAGQQGRCPHCRAVLDVPSTAGPPPAAEPPVSAPAAAKMPASLRRLLPVIAAGAGGVIVIGLAVVLWGRIFGPAATGEPAQAPAGTTVEEGPTQPEREAPQPSEGPPAVVGGTQAPPGPPAASGPTSLGARQSLPGSAAPPRATRGELTGESQQYDDAQCRQIQARHAVRIPPGATILEVDGVRLPILHPERLAESPAPYLFLPPGSHAVRFRPDDQPATVAIASSLFDEYQEMRRFFGVGTSVRGEELVSRSARALDCHGSPFLLSFAGSGYAAAGDWGAAERKFRRALGVNPAFSPAHLNLAECLLRRSADGEAAREIALAEAFNVGNVFGLAGAVAEFRQRVTDAKAAGPVDAAAISYGFADTGGTELELEQFRRTLAALREADPKARREKAQQVLIAMSEVCRKAGFGEAEEYRQMSVFLAGAAGRAELP